MSSIKSFSELSKNDALIAGGKGASLGEMTQAGIPVPKGFVLTSSAFEKFLEESDLGVEIEAILKTVDTAAMHTVEDASGKIQELILAKEIPSTIQKEILSAFQKLGADFVAVRSSATAEDSASAAWAGQLDTFLNTTENALLENIRKCWASLFTPRAVFYRFEKGLHTSRISVAVVVQKMINSEVSGIAFSVHPVTEDRNQIIIEAGFGLGEAIVSGQITPDSYVVTKEPREILDKNITEQERGLFRKQDGGNEWKKPERGSEQKLTDEQIKGLANLIIQIENHYGFPCDIEWALEGGKFYITQSRPITTLSNTNSQVVSGKDAHLEEWFGRRVWIQNWATTNMGLSFPSLYGRIYAKELPKYSGMGFTRNMVMCENGVSSNFIPADELNKICTTHAEQVVKNNALVQKWCSELYTQTDNSLALFKELKKKEVYTITDYRSVENAVHAHVPVNFTLKRVIDYLPPDIIEKYLDILSAVRVYTEEVYPEADRMLRKIASHLFPELTKEELFVLASADMDVFENQGVRPDREHLKERLGGVAIVFDENGKGECIVGERFHRLQKLLTQSGNTSELKGFSAFKGVARGSVRLVFDPSDTKLAEGEILVTGMTRPDFLPLMQKAAAFVTDSGGLLSHAAITARELKKPCIVGTNIATKILKDGDMVEVDAEKGVVRKL